MSMLTKASYSVPAYERQTVPFLGLNRSDDFREGEFADQTNLSLRRYPYLAPRLPVSGTARTDGPEALFCWDGHQIVAAGGVLEMDGEPVCNVTAGAKQFAVVNTKLAVWPDEILVDLEDRSVTPVADAAQNLGTARFTTDSLTFEARPVYGRTTLSYRSDDASRPRLWTYESVAWDGETGWTMTGGAWDLAHNCVGRYYVPEVRYSEKTGTYSAVLPDAPFSEPSGDGAVGNDIGFYGLISSLADYEASADSYLCRLSAELFWAQQEGSALAEVFRAGDVVDISGTPRGVHDLDRAVVESVDPATNTLTFAAGTFLPGDAVAKSSLWHQEYVCFYWTVDGAITRWRAKVTATDGLWCVLDETAELLRVYDEDRLLVAEFAATEISSSSGMTTKSMAAMRTTTASVCVSRPAPKLDYICEHENRLWGVSNQDNTIYASALGDPCTFYDYSGEDTDSWAVAVGSQGDFTGICSYGGSVLCWKEHALHKVLGNYPSNYQTAAYQFAGVGAGSDKSLCNINEVLYFLGVDGVYAYSGNRPSLISRALGAVVPEQGVAGSDGRAYYLSAKRGEAWELLAYDTQVGLWSRWDETQVTDFARDGSELHYLRGDTVYTVGAGDEAVEWSAELCPLYETIEGDKQYNKLMLRVEVPAGAWLAVDLAFDGGRWVQAGLAQGGRGVVRLAVPLRRCDKLQVRLRGVGDCAVLEMARQFRLRGDGQW